ncbi:MAG: OmpA family protein [bacterium]
MSPFKTALRATLGAIGATALIAGCGGKAHIEDTPNVDTAEPVGELTYWEVGLDDALREACQAFDLPEPTFRVDSAEVSEQGRTALAGLAACLNGPMSTMTVRLVGHADVRGTEEYNQELGLERARSVKQVLTQNGVMDNRITVVSHGEAEATGTAESDRRVEVNPQGQMSAADRAAMMRRITIYGVRPVEADVTLEERGDPDGDGADEPETVVRPKAQGGGSAFEEQGDPDGDGADEPPKPVKAKPKSSR